ncbi:hypothetical protein EJ04DRAFT_594984 [Polyplosphaeria fusca]|uniref:Uncharacterized protein n=1 Tax=Polyplosphaeria fusca TaxID=682080 RepID=A0A9P4UW36_9PLEO|nr:hypothetical protein EJ04DRAFT_594984 [Polyplosphaeria fusca]
MQDWNDIKEAAHVIWQATIIPDNPQLLITRNHKAVIICNGETIVIAFLGSNEDEIIKNMWFYGKGENWFDIPYPIFENEHHVHSFYRDTWHGMRQSTYNALDKAVENMLARGVVPKLAFMNIVEHVRGKYGSASSSPQQWAKDENLGSLIQHFTFAAVSSADQGYYTVLNELYGKHKIRAWDFMNHKDVTVHAHFFAFRAWRGHRYILPDAVERFFESEFGPQSNCILGYLKAAEWMAKNGTDQVKSAYSY